MNILHIIPGDLWAGAESQVYYTVRELNKSSCHRVSVILFCRGELYKKLLDIHSDVILLNEKSLSNISIINGIKNVIVNKDVNIVHVHEYKSNILTGLVSFLLGRKKIILFRTQHGQNIPTTLKSHIILKAESFFLRYMTDYLVAVSEDLSKILLNKYTRSRIHLLYNSIPLDLVPSSVSVAEVRKKFDLPENVFWIGTVARLEKVKNIQMLIEAANLIKTKFPEVLFRVSIFGTGSLHKVLESQISSYNLESHVFLEGHYSNILPVLKALDVFTLCSQHEGLPMSLLEAMSVGTIPVCTAVGGMKEVISNEDDGFLVSVNDIEGLANTLTRVFTYLDDLSPLQENAHNKIAKLYSIEQNCSKLVSIYEKSFQEMFSGSC